MVLAKAVVTELLFENTDFEVFWSELEAINLLFPLLLIFCTYVTAFFHFIAIGSALSIDLELRGGLELLPNFVVCVEFEKTPKLFSYIRPFSTMLPLFNALLAFGVFMPSLVD